MVIWKGIEFRKKGIIVEKIPKITKAKKKIDVYEIEGRNGFLSVDTGVYESFVETIECHFNEQKVDINVIKEFLDGYGTLSFDGKTEYTAIIQNAIDFEKILNFRSFVVQFLVNPISEDIIETEYTVLSDNDILNIENATAEMYPIVELTGSGDVSITINGKTFNLKNLDGDYILDSKYKVITHNGINASNQMQYDFPILKPGKNTINYIGSISNFKIKYRKAYL